MESKWAGWLIIPPNVNMVRLLLNSIPSKPHHCETEATSSVTDADAPVQQ